MFQLKVAMLSGNIFVTMVTAAKKLPFLFRTSVTPTPTFGMAKSRLGLCTRGLQEAVSLKSKTETEKKLTAAAEMGQRGYVQTQPNACS